MTYSRETIPPTSRPERGQGPWCSDDFERWWVVAESPVEALAIIRDAGTGDIFPCYFGWRVTIEPVLIAWAEDYDPEEPRIDEQPYETEATTEAWRIRVEGR